MQTGSGLFSRKNYKSAVNIYIILIKIHKRKMKKEKKFWVLLYLYILFSTNSNAKMSNVAEECNMLARTGIIILKNSLNLQQL